MPKFYLVLLKVNYNFVDIKIISDWRVICLALIQSLFESTLYLFILQWTPTLSDASNDVIQHGYIFASFMVAVMIGSTMFKLFNKYQRPESFIRFRSL